MEFIRFLTEKNARLKEEIKKLDDRIIDLEFALMTLDDSKETREEAKREKFKSERILTRTKLELKSVEEELKKGEDKLERAEMLYFESQRNGTRREAFYSSPLKSESTSQASDSRRPFQRFTDYLKQLEGHKFFLNGQQFSLPDPEVFSSAEIQNEFILPSLLLSPPSDVFVGWEEVKSILESCANSKELTAQHGRIKEIYPLLNFYDSHNGYCYHKLPCADWWFKFSAMPDGIHRKLPIFLEFKGLDSDEFGGLAQSMERIAVVSSFYGLIRYSFALGCGKKSKSWWLIHLQDAGDLSKSDRQVHITKLSIEAVAKVLLALISVPPEAYYYSYAAVVINLLNKMDILWNRCQIQRIGCSSSIILKVTSNGQFFCLKVNPDPIRYQREANALKNIFGTSPNSYVYGLYDLQNIEKFTSWPDEVFSSFPSLEGARQQRREKTMKKFQYQLMNKSESTPSAEVADIQQIQIAQNSPDSPVWTMEYFEQLSTQRFSNRSFGGIIIMQNGIPLSQMISSSSSFSWMKLYQDIIQDLAMIHSNGYSHCDIRSNNILFFPEIDKFVLIDFDLCRDMRNIDETFTLQEDSGQYQAAPFYIQRNPNNVDWREKDDYCMFFEYILKKLLR